MCRRDFGHALVKMSGILRKICFFVMALPYPDNPFIESFNGKLRAEYLNENWFLSLADASDNIELRRDDYNSYRPHSSLSNLTPPEFAESRTASGQLTANLQQYGRKISSVKLA